MTKEQYAKATTALGDIIKWEKVKENMAMAFKEDDDITFVFAKGTDKECMIHTNKENITNFVYDSLMAKIDEHLREAKEAFASI